MENKQNEVKAPKKPQYLSNYEGITKFTSWILRSQGKESMMGSPTWATGFLVFSPFNPDQQIRLANAAVALAPGGEMSHIERMAVISIRTHKGTENFNVGCNPPHALSPAATDQRRGGDWWSALGILYKDKEGALQGMKDFQEAVPAGAAPIVYGPDVLEYIEHEMKEGERELARASLTKLTEIKQQINGLESKRLMLPSILNPLDQLVILFDQQGSVNNTATLWYNPPSAKSRRQGGDDAHTSYQAAQERGLGFNMKNQGQNRQAPPTSNTEYVEVDG